MKILIALPTKSIQDPLLSEGSDYLKRLRAPAKAEALFLNPKSALMHEGQRKDAEGKDLLARTEGFLRIALTENGKQYNSTDFARMLERYQQQTTKLAFLIGGAYGLSHDVLQASNATLSLSLLTMPHRMAFLVLAEQIYRSGEIAFGSPYHK